MGRSYASYVSYYKLCYKKLVSTSGTDTLVVSADHKTHVTTDLNKIDFPCELNIKYALQRNLCASLQLQTVFENPTNDNQHTLDLSTLLTSLRK